MRAVLTNFGTRGDFQPLLILAGELARHGHQPAFVAPSFAEAIVRQHGFEFICLSPDLTDLRDKVNTEWVQRPEEYESPERMFKLLAPFQQHFPVILDELSRHCSGADVLISGPAQPLARMVHELIGIPFVSIQVAHFGGSGGEALREAGELLVNPLRCRMGLRPIEDPLTRGANSPQLALYAISKYLRPRPADWPAHYHLTGFFFAQQDMKAEASLEEFVRKGPPPVAITFGSMIHGDESELDELLVEAVRLSGCRAVLQLPCMPAKNHPNHDFIYRAGSVSHGWLFPKAACVVFHGGAGTSAAVFHAGVPGIFVPHGDRYDQRYWAQLANELGCAPQPISFLGLGPAGLAEVIREVIYSERYRSDARHLAQQVRSEQGVRTARHLIERMVAMMGVDISNDEGYLQLRH